MQETKKTLMFSFLSAEPSTRKRKTKCLIAGEGGRVKVDGWVSGDQRAELQKASVFCQEVRVTARARLVSISIKKVQCVTFCRKPT